MIAALAWLPGLWRVLSNPTVLIVAAVIGAYGYGYQQGGSKAEAACDAATLRAELAVRQADLDIATRAAADAAARAAQLEDEGARIREKLHEFENRPDGAACGFTGGNAGRLRSIIGERPAGR